MSTYNQLIRKYKKQLDDKGLSLEVAKAFIYELCNDENINLYLQMDNDVDKKIEEEFEAGIKRILENEPMNYVLGYSYFYGYKLIVNKDVLIPRPETEELVCLVLSKYDEFFKGKQIDVCDVGTGSGAIAISLKKEEKNLNVYASDISESAIAVARKNAENNNAKITFLYGSMLEPYIEKNIKVDILVSNPPYIKTTESLENSVIDYEPHVALFGGEDGLKFYQIIFNNAKYVLKDNGMMFFEIGYDQRETIITLARSYFPNAFIDVFKDINNKNRMLMIKM